MLYISLVYLDLTDNCLNLFPQEILAISSSVKKRVLEKINGLEISKILAVT